ncbi:hypothetical protein LLE49_04420 [Alicyclobacillus tolerans]|uniref:hypothetical protein n=1 Tax=Alicyclobacillus tolerans TaxID=90970 RepID=UPI001F3BB1EF|nr:hypothetical protein [Alicyclobacillus tolerans]MCF8563980.1 hypothetical protein [Alicyclobacillus tolerans]
MTMAYYKYTVVNLTDHKDLVTVVPPEAFVEQVGALLEIIGLQRTDIVIYSHQDGELYRPASEASMADVSLTSQYHSSESIPKMSSAESLELGQRIAAAYIVIRKKFVYLKMKNWAPQKPETQRELADLREKLNIVENAILGTGEMEAVFDLWLRKQFSPEKCAMELHMGKSTWYRRCRAVARHIAYHVTDKLSPDSLRELLRDAEKMEDWMSLFAYLNDGTS